MSRQALITFSCDHCGNITVGSEHWAPEDWWRVTPPESIEWDPNEQLQFCTIHCLLEYIGRKVIK